LTLGTAAPAVVVAAVDPAAPEVACLAVPEWVEAVPSAAAPPDRPPASLLAPASVDLSAVVPTVASPSRLPTATAAASTEPPAGPAGGKWTTCHYNNPSPSSAMSITVTKQVLFSLTRNLEQIAVEPSFPTHQPWALIVVSFRLGHHVPRFSADMKPEPFYSGGPWSQPTSRLYCILLPFRSRFPWSCSLSAMTQQTTERRLLF